MFLNVKDKGLNQHPSVDMSAKTSNFLSAPKRAKISQSKKVQHHFFDCGGGAWEDQLGGGRNEGVYKKRRGGGEGMDERVVIGEIFG